MKMIFYSHVNKTHFHKKDLHLAHFESERFWNPEMASFYETSPTSFLYPCRNSQSPLHAAIVCNFFIRGKMHIKLLAIDCFFLFLLLLESKIEKF